MPENFNVQLKAATDKLHQELETADTSKNIVSPNLSVEKYADYLQKTYIIHYDVENIVFPVLKNIVSGITLRLKCEKITNDLSFLPQKHLSEKMVLLDEDYHNNIGFNLGLMYVTEGSVLGGQFILKNVKRTLGEQTPTTFLNVYNDKTGSLWKSFIASLNEYANKNDDHEREQIISGALYGFKRVYAIFTSN